MKNSKIYFLVIVILFFFMGCKKNNKNITVNSLEQSHSMHSAKDYFIKVKEIKLEPRKESVISFPYDLVVKNKNTVIISSRNSPIIEFNLNGKFLKNIGQIGDGPGEYRQITSIFIFNNGFGIFDFSNQKITIFDGNGKYLRNFSLPFNQVVSLRSIVAVGNSIYIHVPYTPDFPFHILELDSTGSVKRTFLKATKDYSRYSFLGLFHGGITKNESGNILYEMNSFSKNILNKVNLITGVCSKIKLPVPKFFHEIPNIELESSYDKIKRNFFTGTDILKIFLINNKYLIVIYVNKTKMENQVISVIYNLENNAFNQFRNLSSAYSDGKYFYNLQYYSQNSKNKENLFLNPNLIILKLKKGLLE